jgi:hypothetical protein
MFGSVRNPFQVLAPTSGLATSTSGSGLILLISNLFKFSIVIAGIYTLFNLVQAGYGFISAGGDAKVVQKSWERIWRSVLGLVIVAGAMLLAMIIGWLVFGDINFIVSPRIFRP